MKKLFAGLFIFVLLSSVATPALAFPTLIPPECSSKAELDKTKCDDCPLNMSNEERDAKNKSAKPCCCNLSSVERTAVNVSQIILGVTGSIALLIFVIGGIMYMTSGGSSDKVKKATTMLKTAVIGIAIILLAGLIIQTVLKSLTS